VRVVLTIEEKDLRAVRDVVDGAEGNVLYEARKRRNTEDDLPAFTKGSFWRRLVAALSVHNNAADLILDSRDSSLTIPSLSRWKSLKGRQTPPGTRSMWRARQGFGARAQLPLSWLPISPGLKEGGGKKQLVNGRCWPN
jgi:hypothetical protein